MAQVNAGRVRFVGRGEYNNSTQYYTFDLVNYDGNSYFAKSNTLGNLPTNTTYWQLIAEKGDTGEKGNIGDTGNGIASITKTSTSGLVDTYTITFTNGQTTTYEITNGANGSVVDVQVDGTSVVDNGIANIIGLTEMKQELEDMYNLLPKVQGTGETITLDGTVAGKMLVNLKGNTSQDTNIITYTCLGTESGDYYFVYNSTNYQFTMPTISANDVLTFNTDTLKLYLGSTEITTTTASTGTLITMNDTPNPDYPQDIHVVSGDNSINVCGKNLFNGETEVGAYNTTTGAKGPNNDTRRNVDFIDVLPNTTYTLSRNGSTFNCRYMYYDKNKAYINSEVLNGSITTPNNCYYLNFYSDQLVSNYSNLQLELGNQATTYAPYQTPQTYPITLGSSTNTFDVSKVLQGVYNDNSQYNSKRLTFFGELKNNGYVVDVVCNNPNLQFGIIRTSMNTISSSNQNLQPTGYYPNYSSIEFDGEGYVCILIKKADDSDITINDISSNDFNISQSYELCKLGNYQDYIYKTNGNWYFHKNILKVCINGENWVKQANYVFYKRFVYITDKTTKQQTYCNQFIWENRNSGMIYLADNHFAQQSEVAIYVRDNRNQELSTFIPWVNANPLIVYFRLTTPTDTQITDSTLISQLEAVKRSFNGQTNISQENDDKPFILDVTALKELTE